MNPSLHGDVGSGIIYGSKMMNIVSLSNTNIMRYSDLGPIQPFIADLHTNKSDLNEINQIALITICYKHVQAYLWLNNRLCS